MRFPHPYPRFLTLCRRLHDPQVQVWVMAGLSVLLVLIGHVRALSPSGEGKNNHAASPARLLLAGARVTWTEEFGPSQRETRRPLIQLPAGVSASVKAGLRPPAPPLASLRPAMLEAAAQPWKFLDRPLRQELASRIKESAPLQMRISWSGDARGNAALVARQRPPSPTAATWISLVIGNGSRSGDGRIEVLPSASRSKNMVVDITLIGSGKAPTARQTAALGELLNQLEASSGHLLLPDTHPGVPDAGDPDLWPALPAQALL